MIIVDIECSGIPPEKCGVFEIGAIDDEDPKQIFFEDCRIDEDDETEQGALKVTGKTEEQLRDSNKQSQEELLKKFFKWVEGRENKTIVCQNFFDTMFLSQRARKYGLEVPFGWRSLDLHTIASIKYKEIKGEFIIRQGHSAMGLSDTLKFVGMKDERGAHNALEDAKLEAEVFSRLVYGKNLIEEFNKFEIPEYLIK